MRFEEALARWLRQALRGPDGRDRMTHSKLIEESGVGRATLYRLLGGEGQEVDEATLLKLAAALEVPTPHVERVLRLAAPGFQEAPDAPLATPPLALLKEAEALLHEAIKLLEAEPTLSEAEAVRARLTLARTGVRPKRPKRTREKPA